MVDIGSKRRAHEGCSVHPTFGMEGSKMAMYCRNHAKDGMADVSHSFALEGQNAALLCRQDGKDGVVNLSGQLCAPDSCSKSTAFRAETTKAALYCLQNTEDIVVDVSGRFSTLDASNLKHSSAGLCRTVADDPQPIVSLDQSEHESKGLRAVYRLRKRLMSTSDATSQAMMVGHPKRVRKAIGTLLSSPERGTSSVVEHVLGGTGRCDVKVETHFSNV